MTQLDDMRLFVEIIEAESFTTAADRLGISKQHISKRVMVLEARLGVRLLVRTTRRLRATDLGLAYYESAKRILQDVDGMEQAIASQNLAPRGSLRVTAPMSFGTMHLSPVIPHFLAKFPDVSIELDLNDRTIDLVDEGYDMAVRIGQLPDSTLIARTIAALELVTCASPDYLQRRGRPNTIDDLRNHDCLLYGHTKNVEWQFAPDGRAKGVPVVGRLRANNGELVRDTAIAGLGIAHLPTFIVEDGLAQGQLETVLDDCRPAITAVHAVYPKHRQTSLVIKAFADFLTATFAGPRGRFGKALEGV